MSLALVLTLLPAILTTLLLPFVFPANQRRSGLCSFSIAAAAAVFYAGLLYLSTRGIISLPPAHHSEASKATGITTVFVLPIASTLYFLACLVTDLVLRRGLDEERSTIDVGIYSSLLTSLIVALAFAYFA